VEQLLTKCMNLTDDGRQITLRKNKYRRNRMRYSSFA